MKWDSMIWSYCHLCCDLQACRVQGMSRSFVCSLKMTPLGLLNMSLSCICVWSLMLVYERSGLQKTNNLKWGRAAYQWSEQARSHSGQQIRLRRPDPMVIEPLGSITNSRGFKTSSSILCFFCRVPNGSGHGLPQVGQMVSPEMGRIHYTFQERPDGWLKRGFGRLIILVGLGGGCPPREKKFGIVLGRPRHGSVDVFLATSIGW
jgi:hypothetical protein